MRIKKKKTNLTFTFALSFFSFFPDWSCSIAETGFPISESLNVFPNASISGTARPVLSTALVSGRIGSNTSAVLVNGYSPVSSVGPLIMASLDLTAAQPRTFQSRMVSLGLVADLCVAPLAATAFTASPDGRYIVFASQADAFLKRPAYLYDAMSNTATRLKTDLGEEVYWPDDIIGASTRLPVVFSEMDYGNFAMLGYSASYSVGAALTYLVGGTASTSLSLLQFTNTPNIGLPYQQATCGSKVSLYYSCAYSSVCLLDPDDPVLTHTLFAYPGANSLIISSTDLDHVS